MSIRRFLGPLLAAAAILNMTACTGEDESVQTTETRAQAIQRVEALVQEAFTQLTPGATLKINNSVDALACDDPADGRAFVERRYLIVPPAAGTWPTDQIIPTLAAYWEQQGYQVRKDGRSEAEPRYSAETTDGYIVSLQSWDRGDHFDVTLASDSPCVWENGTPD